MKNKTELYAVLFFIFSLWTTTSMQAQAVNEKATDYVVLIHGGAGYYGAGHLSTESKDRYIKSFTAVLSHAQEMLQGGATAVDVVEACIVMMEDDSLFNAGKGAVFTAGGKHTLDASIMDGSDCSAGAIAGVKHTRNPIKAARLVMDSSEHVLLSGAGADKFAEKQGLEQVKNTYFDTYKRKKVWESRSGEHKFGTVGCVVLDIHGNLAAGTSTGGIAMKRYGRIGDSPIIGAGTYANNKTCAISCTGHGEEFIRYVIAYDLHARMKYAGMNLEKASTTLLEFMNEQAINGGFIAIDKDGNVARQFNTYGMLTGQLTRKGIKIKVFKKEIFHHK